MKITALIRAAAPYARPVLASVAIGWGIGVLADTAKQRKAELYELQAAIAEGTGVLAGIQQDIASGHTVLAHLQRSVMALEERAATAERIVQQMQQRAAGLHSGGTVVAEPVNKRADEEAVDEPAPPVAAGPVATEPGCTHTQCVLIHPHAGPAILTGDAARLAGMPTEVADAA